MTIILTRASVRQMRLTQQDKKKTSQQQAFLFHFMFLFQSLTKSFADFKTKRQLTRNQQLIQPCDR